MARRNVRKSNRQSRVGLAFAFMVALIVILVCGYRTARLHQRDKELAIVQTQLETQLEEANNKSAQLDEREKYMKTKKYIEDEAKNKLGLVNSDEILIKPKEKDD